jgi:ABC-2 type transport system permease protein
MTGDFRAVFWKEWKEIVLERSGRGSATFRPLIVVVMLGIVAPLRINPESFFTPFPLLIYSFFSAVVVTAVISDSFAGERERHTLETLLATRLSDRAILFGKVAASIVYGWMFSILCVLVGAITSNASHWQGRLVFFHDAASWLLLLLGPPLAAAMVAAAGVLVSIRASTVRSAQQTLMIGFMVLFLGTVFGANALPTEWKIRITRFLAAWSPTELVLANTGLVLVIDLALVAAGMARFQRAKLILD